MRASVPENIIDEIKEAIATKDYGSVEIYIEAGSVVQITERTIKKTRGGTGYNHNLERSGSKR